MPAGSGAGVPSSTLNGIARALAPSRYERRSGARMKLIERLKAWEPIAAEYPSDIDLPPQEPSNSAVGLLTLRAVAMTLRREKPEWAFSRRLRSLADTLDEAADEMERLLLKKRGILN
jgi:hypothetical protein